MRVCACGCPRQSHEHYRPGKDCSGVGCECASYSTDNRFKRALDELLNAVAGVPDNRGDSVVADLDIELTNLTIKVVSQDSKISGLVDLIVKLGVEASELTDLVRSQAQKLDRLEMQMLSQREMIQTLRENTDTLAVRVEALRAAAGNLTPETEAEFNAISAVLRNMGTDPENPVPPVSETPGDTGVVS